MMRLPSEGVSSRYLASASRQHVLNLGAHLGVVQLALCLALELRLRQLDADGRRQALTHVIAGQIRVGLFEYVRSCAHTRSACG